jgi:hypothetical protein
MFFVALNIASQSWKLSVSVSPLGTYATLPRSVAPSATVLELDVFLLQMQLLNLQIFFRKLYLIAEILSWASFFFCFVLCCVIAVGVFMLIL